MIELFVQQDAGRDLKDYRNKDIRADILFLAECAAAAGAADEARRLLENAPWEIGEAPFFDIEENVSAGLRTIALDRSEERRVGKEGGSTCRTRVSPYP